MALILLKIPSIVPWQQHHSLFPFPRGGPKCSWCFFRNAFSYWQKLSFQRHQAQHPSPSVRHSCTYAHCQLVRASLVDRHCHNSCHAAAPAARPLFSPFSSISSSPSRHHLPPASLLLRSFVRCRFNAHASIAHHPILSHALPMALPALAERKHFLITQMLGCPALALPAADGHRSY